MHRPRGIAGILTRAVISIVGSFPLFTIGYFLVPYEGGDFTIRGPKVLEMVLPPDLEIASAIPTSQPSY